PLCRHLLLPHDVRKVQDTDRVSPASHGGCPHGRGGSLLLESVAALPWNQRQLCRGIGGRLVMESVAAFVWNEWQLWRGISGSFGVEYAGYVRQPVIATFVQQSKLSRPVY